MNVTSKISVDLTRQNVGQRVNAVQGDGNTRLVEIQEAEGAAADMQTIAAAMAKLPPGQLKKIMSEDIIAILAKYGVVIA